MIAHCRTYCNYLFGWAVDAVINERNVIPNGVNLIHGWDSLSCR